MVDWEAAYIDDKGVGMSNTGTFVLLIGTAGMILVDDLQGHGKFNEIQFVALGIVGAIILFVGTFVPDLAFAFAALFALSVLLNSPNGIPFVTSTKKRTGETTGSVLTPKTNKGSIS